MEEKTIETKPSPATIDRPAGFKVLVFILQIVAKIIYHRHVLRNELRDVKGSYVIIANHQSALDFVNLCGLTKHNLTYVFSLTYYNSLPKIGKWVIDKAGVIPKQQFQTQINDLKKMKKVVQSGGRLVIFPAGLMCEDGVSTPIPKSTWEFIRFLDTDVYVARTYGAYFVMPKWSEKKRPGRTDIDVYRLFTREELKKATLDEIEEKAGEAIDFNAYQEQEERQYTYKGGNRTEGLAGLLYQCPCCGQKFHMEAKGNRIYCTMCGFTQAMDEKGFMHSCTPDHPETEFRYVSDWTQWILNRRRNEMGPDFEMTVSCDIRIMDGTVKGFRPAGKGKVTLRGTELILEGILDGESKTIRKKIIEFPLLPFIPGKQFEVQDGLKSYRCIPDDPNKVMEFINTLKILHQQTAGDVK